MAQIEKSLFGSFSSEKEPLSYLKRRSGNKAALAIGLAAALLFHGGLLLVLVIFNAPRPLRPALNPAAVSLVLQSAGENQPSAPVAPRPPDVPAEQPRTAPAIIANSAPARPRVMFKPKPLAALATPAMSSHPAPPAQRAAPAQTATPGLQDFVAAAPLGGNANPPPEYPQQAIDHGEQGQVLLSIHVLPDGTADFVSVTQGSGYRILDQAALDAVAEMALPGSDRWRAGQWCR